MKYRKKPVIIEAFEYDANKMEEANYVPTWVLTALRESIMYFRDNNLYIRTLEGDMHVSLGDYIIKGVKGEIYACKPDIFEQTYEPVES